MLLLSLVFTMKTVNVQARVGNYQFDNVHELEVDSSWETLTDIAKITVPRKLSFEGKNIIQGESLFQKQDEVYIHAGFDGNLQEIFRGYVADIHADVNLTFHCQDSMYVLKQNDITENFSNTTLPGLIASITNLSFQAADVNLGTLRFTRRTPAQILDYLKRNYGIQSWVREGVLYSGLAYWPGLANTQIPIFRFQHNIISESLRYQRGDDEKIKIVGISIYPDNSRKEVVAGDPQGETRTILLYDVPEKDIKEMVEERASQLKYEGYRGDFTTFGEPFVRHGDIISIQDPDFGDRNGEYLVKRVVHTLSFSNGLLQEIHLGSKV